MLAPQTSIGKSVHAPPSRGVAPRSTCGAIHPPCASCASSLPPSFQFFLCLPRSPPLKSPPSPSFLIRPRPRFSRRLARAVGSRFNKEKNGGRHQSNSAAEQQHRKSKTPLKYNMMTISHCTRKDTCARIMHTSTPPRPHLSPRSLFSSFPVPSLHLSLGLTHHINGETTRSAAQ